MWQKPKTNWQPSDFFNIEDYNRIKGNLNEIRTQALILWPDLKFLTMGEDKTYQDYSFYADEINLFEENIEKLREGIFLFSVGEKKTYADNTPFIDWKELNRIESACLFIYENVIGTITGRNTLAFTLNGGIF